MTSTPPVVLIAVVGGSGAGKSWFVERLCRVIGDKACHLELDHFYRDRSHLPPARRGQLNYDVPSAIDWDAAERVLLDCRAGLPARVPRYDFATHCRLGEASWWETRPVVLVDGLWLLRPPSVRALFDLKIYLDTPTNLRCQRRLARDLVERGYTAADIERQLRTNVVPMHERYVQPQKRWADLVLAQPFRDAELVALADRLWTLLTRASLVQPWMHETFRAELLDLISHHEYCS